VSPPPQRGAVPLARRAALRRRRRNPEFRPLTKNKGLHQVRAVTLTGYADVARALRLNPDAMLRRAGIPPQFLADPENRYSAQAVVDLLEQSAARSECETFGLQLAEQRSFAHLGPLSLLLQHLPTMCDVLEALIYYRRLLNDVTTLECEQHGDSAIIRLMIVPEFLQIQSVNLVVALTYRVLKAVSRGGWTAETVHFTHARPHDFAAFRRIFAVPMHFGSAFNGFTCAAAALQVPSIAAEAQMAANARRVLNLIELPQDAAPTTAWVRHALSVQLPTGRATLRSIASGFGKSPRVLQRMLAEEGTTFASVLNEVRKELAQQYLAGRGQRIGFVAELLGFSSASSFSRWFAGQFGNRPARWWRDQAKAASQPPRKVVFEEFAAHMKGQPVDF